MNRGQILKRVNDFIQHPKGMFFVLLNNQIIIINYLCFYIQMFIQDTQLQLKVL